MIAVPATNVNTTTWQLSDTPSTEVHAEKVSKHYWWPNPHVLTRVTRFCVEHPVKPPPKVIEIGPGGVPFPLATHFIDVNEHPGHVTERIDIDYEPLPYPDAFFHFAYCRHTFEDIQNPLFAFNELVRVAPRGYIETPSPLIECTRNVDAISIDNSIPYFGYIHHRYIVWTELETNTLFFLPKYGILEHNSVGVNTREMIRIADNFPVYWNNYYVWDAERPPKAFVYRNGVNFNIGNEYFRILQRAMTCSFNNTNALFNAPKF
jgi:hypothetical protein